MRRSFCDCCGRLPALLIVSLSLVVEVRAAVAAESPIILKAKGLGPASFVQFSPDGKRLVSYHFMSKIVVWDVEKGELLWQNQDSMPTPSIGGQGHGPHHPVALSPDGSLVASLASFGPMSQTGIAIRNAATGRIVRMCKSDDSHDVPSCFLAFSPNGQWVGYPSGPTKKLAIHLWNAKTNEPAIVLEQREEASMVFYMAFSPDGRMLVTLEMGMKGPQNRSTGSGHWVIHFWDTRTKKLLASSTPKWLNVTDPSIAFSPDGKLVGVTEPDSDPVLRSRDKQALMAMLKGHDVFYDLATGKERFRREVPRYDGHYIQFLSDGKSYATSDRREEDRVSMNVVALESGHSRQTFDIELPAKAFIDATLFSSDGRLLAVVNATPPQIALWDVQTGRKLTTLDNQRSRVKSTYHLMPNFSPNNLAFSTDGKRLAAAKCPQGIWSWGQSSRIGSSARAGAVGTGGAGMGGMGMGGMGGGGGGFIDKDGNMITPHKASDDELYIEVWNIGNATENPKTPADMPSKSANGERPRPAMRTWTSADGKFTVEAELVAVRDGAVTLRRRDGKDIAVAAEKLCDADRQWISERRE
jgi:WD40 repeat protein